MAWESALRFRSAMIKLYIFEMVPLFFIFLKNLETGKRHALYLNFDWITDLPGVAATAGHGQASGQRHKDGAEDIPRLSL